jgi:cell division protein FtsL
MRCHQGMKSNPEAKQTDKTKAREQNKPSYNYFYTGRDMLLLLWFVWFLWLFYFAIYIYLKSYSVQAHAPLKATTVYKYVSQNRDPHLAAGEIHKGIGHQEIAIAMTCQRHF